MCLFILLSVNCHVFSTPSKGDIKKMRSRCEEVHSTIVNYLSWEISKCCKKRSGRSRSRVRNNSSGSWRATLSLPKIGWSIVPLLTEIFYLSVLHVRVIVKNHLSVASNVTTMTFTSVIECSSEFGIHNRMEWIDFVEPDRWLNFWMSHRLSLPLGCVQSCRILSESQRSLIFKGCWVKSC